jgi:hypothetical protein
VDRVVAVVAAALSLGSSSALCAACGRGDATRASHAEGTTAVAEAAARQTPPAASINPPSPDCGHAVCADNLFVDATPGAGCAAGAKCTLRLTLVATGDFHINDQYPYRFKADDAAGVTFLGTDEAGVNVFSKNAGDWKPIDAKSGAMTVKLTPHARGPTTVGGVLRLSVCSGATCQLEQSRISAALNVD